MLVSGIAFLNIYVGVHQTAARASSTDARQEPHQHALVLVLTLAFRATLHSAQTRTVPLSSRRLCPQLR